MRHSVRWLMSSGLLLLQTPLWAGVNYRLPPPELSNILSTPHEMMLGAPSALGGGLGLKVHMTERTFLVPKIDQTFDLGKATRFNVFKTSNFRGIYLAMGIG